HRCRAAPPRRRGARRGPRGGSRVDGGRGRASGPGMVVEASGRSMRGLAGVGVALIGLWATTSVGRASRRVRREPPARAAARAAPPRGVKAGRDGRVVAVSARRAYLDRGRADGLTTGLALTLRRGARTVGTCTVELVADHSAACTQARVHVGDVFVAP